MKLEDQVCSLEHAKKLKELGVPQERLFWWTEPTGEWVDVFKRLNPAWDSEDEPVWPELESVGVVYGDPDEMFGIYGEPVTKCSAFTVAELGEMLQPFFIRDEQVVINDPRGRLNRLIKHVYAFEREADARATMLIYLIENNLITL